MPEVDVEILPIVVAAFIPMVVGALWYSPILFGNYWMKLADMTEAKMKESPAPKYALTMVTAFIMSFVLFHFMAYAKVTTNMEALQFAGWVWLGITFTTGLPNHVFDGRPWGLFWIYMGYQLVVTILMSLVLLNL